MATKKPRRVPGPVRKDGRAKGKPSIEEAVWHVIETRKKVLKELEKR